MSEVQGAARKVAETKEQSVSAITPSTSNNATNAKDDHATTTDSTAADTEKQQENKMLSTHATPNEPMTGVEKGTEESQVRVTIADTTTTNKTTQRESYSNLPPDNTGNDRVTVDKPKRPLEGGNSSTMDNVPHSSVMGQNQPMPFPMPGMKTIMIGNPGQPVDASLPPPTPSYFTDEEISVTSDPEEMIRKQRAPLADKYAPYIAPSDTSLDDARKRLRIALDQTRQLRAAFTERVYEKYRICLKPPPQTEEIIETLEQDPRGMFRKVNSEIRRVKAEKELEKKEIQKMNSEANMPNASLIAKSIHNKSNDATGMDKLPPTQQAAMNADTAEQVMYFTAGLSLIVLPEANASNIDMTVFSDRGPIDTSTGQRVRGISSAAASAGETMLDRARRALTLKLERDRKRQQQQQSTPDLIQQDNFDSNYSKGNIAATVGMPCMAKPAVSRAGPPFSTGLTHQLGKEKKTPSQEFGKASFVKRKSAHGISVRSGVINSAASAKAIRARVQATLSMNTLLSLNPIHEELRSDTKYSASTMAMMELGVGNQATQTVQFHKNTPHRFKHPFPDSLGGRRRPVRGTTGVSLLLPAIPTFKECRKFKSIPTVPQKQASNKHAKRAIGNILGQFEIPPIKKRRITEIEFLHGLSIGDAANDQTKPKSSYDSTLVLNVMKAVGLVASSTSDKSTEKRHGMSPVVSSLVDLEKLKAAGMSVESGPIKQSLEKLKALESGFCGHSRHSIELRRESEISNGTSRTEHTDAETLHLRGGGDAVKTSSSSNPGQAKTGTTNGSGSSNHIMQAGTSASPIPSSGNLQNSTGDATGSGYQNVVWDERRQQPIVLMQSSLLGNSGGPQSRSGQMQQQLEHYHQTNALQLAHQLRMSRLPNHAQSGGGDLADYIGGLHQQQVAYDWSAAVASSQSMAALGLNQQQSRTFLTREQQTLAHAAQQQAAVMLGGAGAGGHPYFSGQMLNPAAAAALMGHSGMQRLQGGGQNQGAKNQVVQESVRRPSPQKEKDGDKKSDGVQPSHEKDEKSGDEKRPIHLLTGNKRKSSTVGSLKDIPPSKQMRSSASLDARPPKSKADSKAADAATLQNTCKPSADRKVADDSNDDIVKVPIGLQFYVPPTPAAISSQVASKILAGKFHEAIKSVQGVSTEEGARLASFVITVGTAVPIPKAMVMQRLKDRMNNSSLKTTPSGGFPVSSREVIVAVVMLWLWRNNESCFQRAFAKSGRIDVDSECKWFVDVAVNKAVSALSDQLSEESLSRSVGPLNSALIAYRNKSSVGKDPESIKASSTRIDVLASFIVSRSLNMTFTLNEEMDQELPTFHERVGYLDEARKFALYSKAQERALLAAIVSRKATMSFSFSHSYVSAMVRAGEALGHGSLFEAVQNEKFGVSTMIPYDVFTDESYAWEDPCRPRMGFTVELTGDEMMRRAHARAMIQKSLKKLQERHNVRGGTPIPGPYVDQNASSSMTQTAKSGSVTPRGSSQRRRSVSEVYFQQGSGSAAATSAAVYDPKHACPPIDWEVNKTDNSPYGRHNKRTIPRSLSLAQSSAVMRQTGRGGKGVRGKSASRQRQVTPSLSAKDQTENVKASCRSTREIPWKDVAGIFQQVQLPGTLKEKKDQEEKRLSAKDRTIFAPVVKKLSSMPVIDERESSDDEELSDGAVLARHQVVLNEMKIKLTAIQESRKKNMDRRKSRGKSHK